jgi:hypothetical protein
VWDSSQSNDPRLPWQKDLDLPSTSLTVGNSVWNLLHLATWWTDEDLGLAYARFYGQATEWDDDIQGLPVVQFDLQVFNDAMNGS